MLSYLVAEVDMPRRVDEVQCIHHAIAGPISHAGLVEFDCDAALALEIHPVEVLCLQLYSSSA